jgi:hypothetical protein
MPYSIKKSGSGYKVVEGSSGDRPGHEFSKKPLSRRAAIAQLLILKSKGHGEKYAADCKARAENYDSGDWKWSKDRFDYGEK